ncbi:hypothetical protein PHYBOEH_009524 [Phytophthora boehmeriae]|uniref:Uncharacterized protein n=1 Tax=Phytophthora boehmeriae TaxID=109152 RepID=A0A8T1X0G1_9STRA|nr:hypothetical protein PHYBOEH_009524 [Phytophthora boehmeriae]
MPRRRDLAETPSWAPTGTFTFDGSTSDFALQLYNRYADSGSIGKLGLSVVPDVVVSRLEDVGVTFDDLDGFAQRAVLWDSGFAVTADNEAKRIWTIGGRSMAELALTLDEYEATGCTTFQCTQPDGAETYNNNLCNETAMFTGVKCIAEEFEQHNLNLAMWSIGGESTMGLEIELVNHNWDDHGIENKVYAVHTVSSAVERQTGTIRVGHEVDERVFIIIFFSAFFFLVVFVCVKIWLGFE